jgi:hypothetical protein
MASPAAGGGGGGGPAGLPQPRGQRPPGHGGHSGWLGWSHWPGAGFVGQKVRLPAVAAWRLRSATSAARRRNPQRAAGSCR